MILSQLALKNSGSLLPITFSNKEFPSLTNSSILKTDEKLLLNVRNVDYVIYSSDLHLFDSWAGSVVYVHKDHNHVLETKNYIVELCPTSLNILKISVVDTTKFDTPPQWTFIGLEDARLVEWNNTLYQCGVRRDTESTGIGRMELVAIDKTSYNELKRFRMPAPDPDTSYCEKNWMPIKDLPFHFVKWSNPTEVVKFDILTQKTSVVHLGSYKNYGNLDWRGGSQVITFNGGYLAVIHETELFRTQKRGKDCRYRHKFLFWDKNWNLLSVSPSFSFLNGEIEFCCGIEELGDFFLISFGFQDNASFILKIKKSTVKGLL